MSFAIKKIGVNSFDLAYRNRGHAKIVVDHQLRELIATNQNNPAFDLLDKIKGAIRKFRGGYENTFLCTLPLERACKFLKLAWWWTNCLRLKPTAPNQGHIRRS